MLENWLGIGRLVVSNNFHLHHLLFLGCIFLSLCCVWVFLCSPLLFLNYETVFISTHKLSHIYPFDSSPIQLGESEQATVWCLVTGWG